MGVAAVSVIITILLSLKRTWEETDFYFGNMLRGLSSEEGGERAVSFSEGWPRTSGFRPEIRRQMGSQ